MLTQEQTDFFLVKAYNAALRAGARILDMISGRTPSDQTSEGGSVIPLTLADACSHECIKTYLSQTRIPMLSAEGRDMLYQERCHWDLFWMVDPLDGTQEFVRGNGEFTINIALMYENQPVIGIIYVPYIHKMYFALRHQGAYLKTGLFPREDAETTLDQIWEGCRALPLHSQANHPIRIAISRSHNTPETFECIEHLKQKYPGAEVIEQGSSYKFCLLAEATVDLYVRTSQTYEWDTAAGDVILSEAGGQLTSLDGKPFVYNKQTLNNPHFIGKNKFL